MILGGFKSFVFVRADSKGVTGRKSVRADSKALRGKRDK
jgi:hypothetical protein